ncbi:MAG: sigma 54-dependent Fis family transcriptional regulator [Deltaproteobacteria bacterium]|jgi:DNA-binding NtrC family response regulator|nr:sigma 54-dependent Fis family transcriptional regulator [Deltaproteobacteria bacterium]MBW2534446.1 sigma 54-dependent Fis family transcriptional regulator [Deltaproteobacteria bacterium]
MTDSREPSFDETATLVRDVKRDRPLEAVVRVLGAPATPELVRLSRGTCTVGSADDADIRIAEPTVSRHHVRLALVPEGVLVEDLGSHNGTTYHGQRIQTLVMALGGRIQVGAVTLALELDSDALEQALPPYVLGDYRGIVGPSPAMRRLFATLERLEGTLANVLVEGPSGVGKELIATALHEGSSVADGPFVVVNCGAIAPELVASELFGHTVGAYTGAVTPREGAFASAHGGTLFLDEIGELPLQVQPMLLRTLETGEVRPLGTDAARQVKVRIVAATNRRLEEEVAAGRFREDLYFRLAVVRLSVPPLRERPQDVGPLARHFAAGIGLDELPETIIDQLAQMPWPGNARELRNAVEAYAALGTIQAHQGLPSTDLDRVLRSHLELARPYGEQKDALVERFTRLYLETLLDHTKGNQTAAARLAGLGRSYFNRLLQKYGLRAGRTR